VWVELVTDVSRKVALGEMVSQFPISRWTIRSRRSFRGSRIGFAMGVLYWYK